MADLSTSRFGQTRDGDAVDAFVLTSAAGVRVRVLAYGGIIQMLEAPDRDGTAADVVLGFDALEPYLDNEPYFGAVIGRYANRIARGRFALDGAAHQLAINEAPHHLHGGDQGFHRVLWQAAPFEEADAAGVALTYTSADGEEGYPGRLDARVTYTLTDDGTLRVAYRAETTAATPVSLTQHSYFNLGGAAANGPADVRGHELTMPASWWYLPLDETAIPTGEIRSVDDMPFDFRETHPIGARLDAPNEQLEQAGGYDHCYALNVGTDRLAEAARVVEPQSGRVLTVQTTAPGVQLYTGNKLDGSVAGKGGRAYPKHAGLCLETQQFPDAPNRRHFPSAVLRPGDVYESETVFAFSVV